MVEGGSGITQYTPNYEAASSFVLTSKNIGSILAIKTNNEFAKYEAKEHILESTTSQAQKDDFMTLLKIEKKVKQQPAEDKIEFEVTYFEAKDDELLKSTKVTISLGQMIVTQLLCKKFFNENVNGWSILSRR